VRRDLPPFLNSFHEIDLFFFGCNSDGSQNSNLGAPKRRQNYYIFGVPFGRDLR
jgi:hypothetical protein